MNKEHLLSEEEIDEIFINAELEAKFSAEKDVRENNLPESNYWDWFIYYLKENFKAALQHQSKPVKDSELQHEIYVRDEHIRVLQDEVKKYASSQSNILSGYEKLLQAVATNKVPNPFADEELRKELAECNFTEEDFKESEPMEGKQANNSAGVLVNKNDWNLLKSRIGELQFQGLINLEDLVNLMGSFEDKFLKEALSNLNTK